MGTQSVTAAPAPSEKKAAPSREQRDKLRKSTVVGVGVGSGVGAKQPGRKPETMREWM